MDIWFWSDPHLGHSKSIKYFHRPFKSLKEMDTMIITKCNNRVKEDDLIFCIGDFCLNYSPSESPDAPKKAFEYYRKQINCKNIIFLRGNHDKQNAIKTVIQSIVINYGGHRIFLTHDPKYARKEFFFNFTGHRHGKYGIFYPHYLNKNSTIVDLSVENWNYEPVSYNEIWQQYSMWKKGV